MSLHYVSAVEYIKNRPFDVLVPAYYQPYLPNELLNPSKEPLPKINKFYMVSTRRRPPIYTRQLDDYNRLEKGAFSIELMLDMFKKKVYFELCDESDTVEILNQIDRYLISLKHDVESNVSDVVDYAKLVIEFRGDLYKHYYRYMKTHPTALANLYPNNDPEKSLFNLFNLTRGLNDAIDELDPLKAKANPPYKISSTDKISEDSESYKTMIDTSLGLSNRDPMTDTVMDVDFSDFLKRG